MEIFWRGIGYPTKKPSLDIDKNEFLVLSENCLASQHPIFFLDISTDKETWWISYGRERLDVKKSYLVTSIVWAHKNSIWAHSWGAADLQSAIPTSRRLLTFIEGQIIIRTLEKVKLFNFKAKYWDFLLTFWGTVFVDNKLLLITNILNFVYDMGLPNNFWEFDFFQKKIFIHTKELVQ